MTKRLLVMAGGTGGHIFPGIAVAKYLQNQGWDIHWLGTATRMEAQLVPKAGFAISYIDVTGVRGNGLLRLLGAPFHIAKSVFQAIAVIRQFKPNVVLGMGGFAAGPGGIAAWLLGVPVVIHEQNAVPGMTNKILSRFASRLLVGFKQAFSGHKKAIWVGNPVRAEFAQIAEKVNQSEESVESQNTTTSFNILVVGGSLGAQCLNETVPNAIEQLFADEAAVSISIRHQCGKGHQDKVTQAYTEKVGSHCEWQVSEFISDMVEAYAWADVIICRAGALTVAEVAASGRCAIFVPLPHAVDDHQTLNAKSLADADAAILMPQSELMTGALPIVLKELIAAPSRINALASHAKQQAKVDAAEQVAKVCMELSKVGA
ncbi:undecaprenyldiphospho-muramoylpentapeptide beta-N-acetylglucosaminyltransferase [Alteromonas sp. a30]|uniref:undecaprenyldiphospho-muramoylpentapeptide beta-N-acetylglucosaminyltransferase n=1 Tax=Alteromonas sp. a30 TaxID=2730917 RepID=UPI0022812075|nr:undecaprenyldiphospho-muramoylpentapeptide beta-N-acetylglucosaminyltransferase [Alteromonas sp. a30]MCY7294249.1 undecaprenyldiphospho-muramoylpentapeptide beta-N-acetylglucosaminyltransferase [Alteromonas sp. a30]